jgi:hypothetical protein
MHPDWARSIRDQCTRAGVPFFFKQWGEWLPSNDDVNFRDGNEWADLHFPRCEVRQISSGHTLVKVGKSRAGRLLDGHEWNETEFLQELARRTGCGLLLDVNNVHVSACNMGYSAEDYLDAFPVNAVMEIHLAGHAPDPNLGDALLVDSHDAPVAPAVWALYERLIRRIGARPTLIERDDNLPAFDVLLAERDRAAAVLRDQLAEAA